MSAICVTVMWKCQTDEHAWHNAVCTKIAKSWQLAGRMICTWDI